jgi:hypothetical protein
MNSIRLFLPVRANRQAREALQRRCCDKHIASLGSSKVTAPQTQGEHWNHVERSPGPSRNRTEAIQTVYGQVTPALRILIIGRNCSGHGRNYSGLEI